MEGLKEVGFKKYGAKYISLFGFDADRLNTLISISLKASKSQSKTVNN